MQLDGIARVGNHLAIERDAHVLLGRPGFDTMLRMLFEARGGIHG